jgi:glutamyl-tRNA synthetase
LVQVLYAQRERCQTLIEMVEKSRFWYEDFAAYVEKDAAKHLVPAAKPRLAALIEALNALSDWTAASIHTALHGVIEAQSLKLPELAMPIRVACCGMAISPPVDVTLELLGRERTLARLHQAVAFIA